jgi:hypothetical protein
MSSLRSLVGAGAGSLARRIDRLRNTLHLLSEKLREAVSTAIGQEVAEAVRDVVFTMLTGPPNAPDFADRRAPPYHQTRSLWNPTQESEEDYWQDAWNERSTGYREIEEKRSPNNVTKGPNRRKARWCHSLAAGLEAGAWWLRRRAGRLPVLAAFVAGLTTALLACTAGWWFAAAVGLAGSALGLMSFLDAAKFGTSDSRRY